MTLEDIIRANPDFQDWRSAEMDGLSMATFSDGEKGFGIAWRGNRHISAPWPWTDAQIERAQNVLGSVKVKTLVHDG